LPSATFEALSRLRTPLRVKTRSAPFLALLRFGAVGFLAGLTSCTPAPVERVEEAPATPVPATSTLEPAAPAPSKPAAEAEPAPTDPIVLGPLDFTRDMKPLLDGYCFKCHGNGKKKGGLALDAWTSLEIAVQDQKTWKHVLEAVRTGEMPPDDEKQPTLVEREKMMAWIDRTVFAVDPANPDPGRVTIRRLNRVEYNNTIRDLVGVDFQPADDFPADDSGYGFDNVGDVLSLPPVLFERYLAAAEKVMSLAILNDHKPRPAKIYVDLMLIEGGPKTGTTSVARKIDENESKIALELPVAGEYAVQLVAESEKIGGEGAKLEWKFNGQTLRTTELSGRRDAKDTLKAAVRVDKPGTFPLTLRVANPLPKPEMKDGRPVARTLTVRQIRLTSPPQPVKAPPSQYKIFAPGRGQRNLELAAKAILADFGRRAFRRPLGSAEVERFFWIAKQAEKKGANFEQAVQTALTAILVSPHFLFRGELQLDPDNPKATTPISEWALAARLSYFLWSTMPDDALSTEAAKGTLRKNLTDQVKRMLADPKADALVENYASQWLQTRNLQLVQPDARTFPEWDHALATAMQRETELLFQRIMREDRSVLELVGADYSFVNERLARHYRIPGVEGEAFVQVKLPADRPGGILGHGSFLTLTSNPTRTSPVKRGKYVLENLLGTPPPPPPPEVPNLDDKARVELVGTLRQRMEQHRVDPNCASCHARMDPIGFGLEQFDGIGAWRDRDEGAAIDPTGQLVSGEQFQGPAELRAILLTKKRGDFLRCSSEKMLTYALGRGLEFYDRLAVEKITRSLEKNPNFSNLVLEVVNSVPFQKRRGEGDHRQFTESRKTAAATP
jgi:mono/diheme cytochrome c family protein